jgi:hypothetical protein
MHVYLVFQNDALLGVYGTGRKAVKRLQEVKGREPEGNWARSKAKEKDPYVQRWWQPNGRIARLSIEKEEVQ